MNDQHIAIIHGREMGARVSSRILEEEIQKVISSGFRQSMSRPTASTASAAGCGRMTSGPFR